MHVLRGTVQDSLLQYLFHSFTMPLFIGLSGYLYNFEKLLHNPKGACAALFKTIVLPWLIVSLLYASAVNYSFLLQKDWPRFLGGLGNALVYAYYHLWYISGYLSYILVVYLMLRFRLGDKLKVFLGMAISFVVCYFYVFMPQSPYGLRIFLNNFRMYNLIFFIIGYLMRAYKRYLRLSALNITLVALLFAANTVAGFYLQGLPALHYPLKFVLFYCSNALLILFALTLCINFPNIRSSFLRKIEHWGRNSLFIYLYHAFPVLLIRQLMPVADFFYYLANALSLMGVMLLLRLSRRFPFLRFISWI